MAEINSLPDAAPPPLAATQPRLLAANRRRPDPYNQRLLTRISTPARLGRGLERAPRPRPYRRAWPPSQRTPLPPRRHSKAHRTSVAGSLRTASRRSRQPASPMPRAAVGASVHIAPASQAASASPMPRAAAPLPLPRAHGSAPPAALRDNGPPRLPAEASRADDGRSRWNAVVGRVLSRERGVQQPPP